MDGEEGHFVGDPDTGDGLARDYGETVMVLYTSVGLSEFGPRIKVQRLSHSPARDIIYQIVVILTALMKFAFSMSRIGLLGCGYR